MIISVDDQLMWSELLQAWLNSLGAQDMRLKAGLTFSWRGEKFEIAIPGGLSDLCLRVYANAHVWGTRIGLDVDLHNPDFDPVQFFEPFKQEMEMVTA